MFNKNLKTLRRSISEKLLGSKQHTRASSVPRTTSSEEREDPYRMLRDDQRVRPRVASTSVERNTRSTHPRLTHTPQSTSFS